MTDVFDTSLFSTAIKYYLFKLYSRPVLTNLFYPISDKLYKIHYRVDTVGIFFLCGRATQYLLLCIWLFVICVAHIFTIDFLQILQVILDMKCIIHIGYL